MKKKLMVLSLTLCLVVSVMFIGENKVLASSFELKEPVEINVFNMRVGAIDVFNRIMKDLADDTENLSISTNSVGWGELEDQSRIILSAGGESPYGIMQVYNGWLPSYVHNDWVRTLNDYYEKYEDEYNLDDISEELWDVSSHEGLIYAFPFQQNLQHTFYRKDIFEKHDIEPPKTFDEMFEVLEALKEEEEIDYPYALSLANDGVGTEFNNALIAHGGKWFDEDHNPMFNSEEGLKAVEYLKDLMDYMPKEVLSYNNDNVSVGLQQGSIAMANLWTTRSEEVEDENVSRFPDQMGYAPPPSYTLDGTPYTNWTQDMFVIPKETAVDPEILFKVIAETLTQNNLIKAAEYTIVSRDSVANNPDVLEANPNYQVVFDTIDNGAKAYPIQTYFNEARLILNTYVREVLAGEMEPQEALDIAEEEVIEMLEDEGYLD